MTERDAPFDPGPAADVLAAAWRNGGLLSELPASVRPSGMMEGYDVQDRLVATLGEEAVGWKLGMGSAIQKRQSGVGRSLAGRVLRRFVQTHEGTVVLPNDAPATIEFEIAFVLSRDVGPDEAGSPLDSVGELRPAFELVLSRFVDRRAVGWPSFVADNGAFQALVLGDPIGLDLMEAMADDVVVAVDGAETARRVVGDDVTNPVEALADLMALAGERGVVLPKGSIVSTGTVTKPFTISGPGKVVEARFLGRTLSFRTARSNGNTEKGEEP